MLHLGVIMAGVGLLFLCISGYMHQRQIDFLKQRVDILENRFDGAMGFYNDQGTYGNN